MLCGEGLGIYYQPASPPPNTALFISCVIPQADDAWKVLAKCLSHTAQFGRGISSVMRCTFFLISSNDFDCLTLSLLSSQPSELLLRKRVPGHRATLGKLFDLPTGAILQQH